MADTATGAAPQAAPKLDELMLAMDVVDTLRHQEQLALKELGQDSRDDVLKERLRKLYEGQGLTVSDRILDEGIRALKESRFTYQPPQPGFGLTMAKLWVYRRQFAGVAAVLFVVAAGLIGWQILQYRAEQQRADTARIELTETLPTGIDAVLANIKDIARDDEALGMATAIAAAGKAAAARGDADAARGALSQLGTLERDIAESYELRIVSRPGEPSAVARTPDANDRARNYYVIVEAVAPGGVLIDVPVTSEEDGKTSRVTKWGVRVPRSTFEAIRRDKSADGIVDDNILAEKPRGVLKPVPVMAIEDGAITDWSNQ